MVADGKGGVWAISNAPATSWVTHMSASGDRTQYRVPSSNPELSSIAIADGSVYFTEENTSEIGVVTPGGEVKEYHTPSKISGPVDAIAGAGKVWFAEGHGIEENGDSSEAIAEILPSGRIIEHDIKLPPSQLGAGAYYLQNDFEGGVWFVATRHYEFCSPVACPPFIGHLEKSGTLTRRPTPGGAMAFATLSDPDGLWVETLGPTLAYMGKGGRVKQYRGRDTMQTLLPFGFGAGKVWVATSIPFALFTATPERRSSFVRLEPPGAGRDDRFHPVMGKGFLWMIDSDRPIFNTPNATYAYRYDLRTNVFDTVRMAGKLKCISGLEYTPVLSGDTLWAADTCVNGHLWAVTFPD
jgi:hypothetical protein